MYIYIYIYIRSKLEYNIFNTHQLHRTKPQSSSPLLIHTLNLTSFQVQSSLVTSMSISPNLINLTKIYILINLTKIYILIYDESQNPKITPSVMAMTYNAYNARLFLPVPFHGSIFCKIQTPKTQKPFSLGSCPSLQNVHRNKQTNWLLFRPVRILKSW